MDHEIKSLSRRELVDAIAWEIGITQAKAAPVVHATIEKIAAALASRRRVELRGLGSFEVIEKRARWTTDPNTGRDLRAQAKYTVRFRPSKDLKRPADMSLSMNRPVKPEAAMTFSSERTARRFASMALARFPRAEVQCSGRKVKIKHGSNDAEGIYALAQRVHRRPKKRVAMAQPPVDDSSPRDHDEPVSLKVYFKNLYNAQKAVQTLRELGCRVKSDIGDMANEGRGHTITVVGSDRAEINRVISELKGAPVSPEPRFKEDGTLAKDFAFAMGGRRTTSDWEVRFASRSKRLPVAIYTHLKNDLRAHVTQVGQNAIVFHRMTYDEVMTLLGKVNIPGDEVDKNKFGNRMINGRTYVAGDPRMIGGVHEEDILSGTPLKDDKASLGDAFKYVAAEVASEVGTQKAADLLRRVGVDIFVVGGGLIAFAFKEALTRAVTQWLNQVGGHVVKTGQSKNKPSLGALKSWLGGLKAKPRDDAAARAHAIRQGKQYTPPAQSGGGFFRNLFNRGSGSAPPLQGDLPRSSSRPVVEPPADKTGYRPIGKGSRNKGTFSFALDSKGTHLDAVRRAVKEGHGHVKTFRKGGEIHSHMTKGNYAPYTLVTNADGEMHRLQGHTGLPAARATAEGAVNIAKTAGGFAIKFANKAFKTLAMLYATKLGIDILNDGVDYVVVREIGLARKLASVIASAVMRRPIRFAFADESAVNAARQIATETHGMLKIKRKKYKPAAMAIDYIGLAYAVMDFLSAEATRAVADALVETGIKVTKAGATKLVATVKDGDQLQKVKALTQKARGRLRLRRGAGGQQSKSASFGFGDVLRDILSRRGPTGDRILRSYVIPGGAVLVFATAVAAHEAVAQLAKHGVRAVQKGLKVLVRSSPEMGFANEVIKRPKWRKVDTPEDAEWWKYEKARRKYAQGRGPAPSDYRPDGGKRIDDFSPGQFGLMLVTLVAAYPVQVALAVALQKAGIAVKHVGNKILAKVMGLKQMSDLRKLAAEEGAKVESVKQAKQAMSFAYPWGRMARGVADVAVRSPTVWLLVGGAAWQVAERIKELGVKVRKQNKMLAEIDVTDPEQLAKVARIARSENVSLRKKLDEHAESQPITEKIARVGRYAAVPVALGVVAFFKYKQMNAALHDLAQLGVKALRSAADKSGRGRVTITQLTPEQLASVKHVVAKYGGSLKQQRISASMAYVPGSIAAKALINAAKRAASSDAATMLKVNARHYGKTAVPAVAAVGTGALVAKALKKKKKPLTPDARQVQQPLESSGGFEKTRLPVSNPL